jgi:hypothetical protein
MNRFFGKLSAATITLMVLGVVAAAVAADEKKQFEKPSFSQGDYWVYSTPDGEERREYVGEKDGYHVFMINGAKQLLDANLNMKGGTHTAFQFPLYVGKYWGYDFNVSRSASGGQLLVRAACEVKSIEPVETAAGTFQALNITCDEVFVAPGTTKTRRNYSYWYAPEVKQLIKNTHGQVLKEYKIKK